MLLYLQQNRDRLDLHFDVTDFFYKFSPPDWTGFSNPARQLARCLLSGMSPAIRLLALVLLYIWNDFLPIIWVVVLQILRLRPLNAIMCQ